MPMLLYRLTREVTPGECQWLHRTFHKGEVVHAFTGVTYGCIGPDGEACILTGSTSFFELPRDALRMWDDDDRLALFQAIRREAQ